MRPAVLPEVAAAGAELLVGERLRPRHPVAVHARAIAPGAEPVLHADDLGGEPRARERHEDPRPPTSRTRWWSRPRRRHAARPFAATGPCRGPRSAATCRTGHRTESPGTCPASPAGSRRRAAPARRRP